MNIRCRHARFCHIFDNKTYGKFKRFLVVSLVQLGLLLLLVLFDTIDLFGGSETKEWFLPSGTSQRIMFYLIGVLYLLIIFRFIGLAIQLVIICYWYTFIKQNLTSSLSLSVICFKILLPASTSSSVVANFLENAYPYNMLYACIFCADGFVHIGTCSTYGSDSMALVWPDIFWAFGSAADIRNNSAVSSFGPLGSSARTSAQLWPPRR